ncbi:MAG: hypothetical protein J0I12_03295 [Candidatus Eremiobacteraeota bacterium]|nr:hypothetical protein [Candidatus Eremiobacteraeota bacterium]
MTNWTQLLYRGLQAGGAAFIVSAALSQAARHILIQAGGPQARIDMTIASLVGSWFFLGLLCLAPVVWALYHRLTGVYRLDNPQHLTSCREAAAFSLFASPLWWLAPALIQAGGH